MASELSEAVAKKKFKDDLDWADWNRTGDKVADQLHFYLTGLHYDCTFRASVVSNEEPCAKTFRCHKLILATVSKVFEKMLFGGFKEAKQSQDAEIKVEVSPTAFDISMRFIYGNKCDFQSCELAVEIYYFANKWMIESLVRAAEEFLLEQQGPDDALLVYEMCIDLNIALTAELRTQFCMIIQKKTNQVLSSKHWPSVSRETMINIYCMPRLSVGEAYLLEKLVLWGKARCSSDQSTDLRAEIDPMLKNIRFRSMSCEEFSAISKEHDVLTAEEKFKIMESLVLSDANLMPPAFSLKGCPRNLTNCKMVDWSSMGKFNDMPPDRNEPIIFHFYIAAEGISLGGIYMLVVDDVVEDLSFTCTLLKLGTGKVLGMAKSDGVSYKGDKHRCILFDEAVALAIGSIYYIKIDYNSRQATCTSFFNGSNAKNFVRSEFCNIFFHPYPKVRDVCGFQLLKR